MPDAAVKAKIYNGLFRLKVDDKRRVPVHFHWRPENPDEVVEFTLTIWPKHRAGTCILVLPPNEMDKLLAEINAMPSSNPYKSFLKRHIGTKSEQAKLDRSGRITLPEHMAKAANITNTAILAGKVERFEIWSPERYEQVEIMDKSFEDKAFEMME